MGSVHRLYDLLRQRILVLEGPKGTMVQRHMLTEDGFRGERFRDHSRALRNNNDVLSLTQPDLVRGIHREFLDCGADIVATNTFNATSISQSDFGLESHVREINLAAARIAREAADGVDRDVLIAGTMGPTNRTASLSPDVNDPGHRSVTFDELRASYAEQAEALVDGGVDLLLIETVFDTLNLKAALYAVEELFAQRGGRVPVAASVTMADASGRTLSGQTLEAFWISIAHADLCAVGLNCALGPEGMRAHLEELSRMAPIATACYPNAGLPNALGAYDESPEAMAAVLGEFARNGWLNIVGGCCGTTPDHLRAIARSVEGLAPRVLPAPTPRSRFSGLEPLVVTAEAPFVMVGERTNVTGSPQFARCIREERYDDALTVARRQIENGANVIDVCMDEALLDTERVMGRFLNLAMSDPDIARVPVMVDSSRWEVILDALKRIQGKAIVNSISLKEGETVFRDRARVLRRFGAAAVVMAFDESGQAVTVEHKVAIARRAYRILTEEVGFPAGDIIFDPNVLTVGTGIEEHRGYGVAFIEAVRRIKQECPGSLTSGGISNVSFAFRGNNPVREAMHAVFLYHAVAAGLDVGIVNAGQLIPYDDVEPSLREMAEDLLLDRREDATDRLLAHAAEAVRDPQVRLRPTDEWRSGSVDERLAHALIKGVLDHLEGDVAEAVTAHGSALAVIEGPLMAGMNRVGDAFADGRMFLPQVVKSARAMKRAVAFLEPLIAAERAAGGPSGAAGRVVLATVRGDVHDIGKNIVGVVLGCNGFEVIDLGVMAACETILDAARDVDADIVGLSGLITPSLDEMAHVAREMDRQGFTVPLLVGGATTSETHTALRIATQYAGGVVHVRDASRAAGVVRQLRSPDRKAEYLEQVRLSYTELRVRHGARADSRPLLPIADARARAMVTDWSVVTPAVPAFTGARNEAPALGLLRQYIDWTPFFHVWEIRGRYPAVLDDPERGEAARTLLLDAQRMLDRMEAEHTLSPRGVWGFFPAASVGDDIVIYADPSRSTSAAVIHGLRQQAERLDERPHLAMSDFVAPADSGREDFVGAFAVTSGHGLDPFCDTLRRNHDDYGAIMAAALADRLAEAFAEWLHQQARAALGYGAAESLAPAELATGRYRGIRPAPGYPACPDHSHKSDLFRLLDASSATGIVLTETLAMWPGSSVCGWYFGHPASRYFNVGRIGSDQLEDYCRRRGVGVDEARRWIAGNLEDTTT